MATENSASVAANICPMFPKKKHKWRKYCDSCPLRTVASSCSALPHTSGMNDTLPKCMSELPICRPNTVSLCCQCASSAEIMPAASSKSVAPVFRLSMEMRDGDHQDLIAVLDINYAIGKTAQATPSDTFAQGMPGLRVPLDQIKGLERFDEQGIAQPRRLHGISRDGIVKLLLGRFEQTERHTRAYFASTSASGIARISPRR